MARLNSWQTLPAVIVFAAGAFTGLFLSKEPIRITIKPPHMGEVIVEVEPSVCQVLISSPEDIASHGPDQSDSNA
jgi:hypothetical protein